LIRHAGAFGAFAVLPLPIPVIKPAFRALLMAAVGGAPLPEPGGVAAWRTTITLAAVAVGADEEQGVAIAAYANPEP
jgi:hypothetical protein